MATPRGETSSFGDWLDQQWSDIRGRIIDKHDREVALALMGKSGQIPMTKNSVNVPHSAPFLGQTVEGHEPLQSEHSPVESTSNDDKSRLARDSMDPPQMPHPSAKILPLVVGDDGDPSLVVRRENEGVPQDLMEDQDERRGQKQDDEDFYWDSAGLTVENHSEEQVSTGGQDERSWQGSHDEGVRGSASYQNAVLLSLRWKVRMPKAGRHEVNGYKHGLSSLASHGDQKMWDIYEKKIGPGFTRAFSRGATGLHHVSALSCASAPANFVVHPTSTLRAVWMCVTCAAWMYEFITVPIELAQGEFKGAPNHVIFLTCIVVWTLDLVFNFNIAVHVQGVLKTDRVSIAKAYIKTWFCYDFTVVLFGWFSLFTSETSSVLILRGLRIVALMRLFRSRKLLTQVKELLLHRIIVLKLTLPLVRLMLVYVAAVHLTACLAFAVRSAISSEVVFDEYVGMEGDTIGKYLLSCHWAISFLVWSDVDPLPDNWDSVVLAAFRLGVFFVAPMLFARVAWNLQNLAGARVWKLQRDCEGYLQSHDISSELSLRTQRYLDAYQAHLFLSDELDGQLDVISKLPKVVQVDVCEEANATLFCKRPFFQAWQKRFRALFRKLCFEAMSERISQMHETLFDDGEAANSVMAAFTGKLCYTPLRNIKSDHVRSTVSVDYSEQSVPEMNVSSGKILCEVALWTDWIYHGRLMAMGSSKLLTLDVKQFCSIISGHTEARVIAVSYARKFIDAVNHAPDFTEISEIEVSFDDLDGWYKEENGESDHFIFLSHYKVEAGTEAVLLQESLVQKVEGDLTHGANAFKHPVFLDSEHLSDLTTLKDHILETHNLILLLTPGVLSRPYCLIEIVTSVRNNVNVIPVEVQKPGLQFCFPDNAFYEELRTGRRLSEADLKLLEAEQITTGDVELALRHVFKKIVLQFSPHQSSALRKAEVNSIWARCALQKSRTA
eukprot:TRINITY_DN6512_c0_g1_i3.p1 TRINITY_DN6512_c0_g1~~TRINITY_DN6512_c0_g1_i3.p1  ORF type:complete len:950 (-),score=141.07 TRINITY_DN6512_c0_g1_i3:20-2869(-)